MKAQRHHDEGKDMDIDDKITVIGAGLMGTSIATLCAAHGYRVVLHDQDQSILKSFRARATPIARHLSSGHKSHSEILDSVICVSSLEKAVEGASLVQEAIHEDLASKRILFQKLDDICQTDVMLSTNSSSFMLSDIGLDVKEKNRIIGIHYVSPAHLIRAVEIIIASFTPDTLIDRAKKFLKTIDHVGITCRERPGFLINRVQYALKAEIQRMVDEGFASVEDIDEAVRLAIGPRLALWGPFMQEDLAASKRTVLSVMEYLHKTTNETHYESTPVLRNLVESGNAGAASGAGWYEWSMGYEQLMQERDMQLSQLLDYLRSHDRLDKLGRGRCE